MVNPLEMVRTQESLSFAELPAADGSSALALWRSSPSGSAVSTAISTVSRKRLDEISSVLPGEEERVSAVHLRLSGFCSGWVAMLASIPDAKLIVDISTGVSAGSTRALGALERTALGLAGELAATLLLERLTAGHQPRWRFSPPAVTLGGAASILATPTEVLGPTGDHALVATVSLSSASATARGILVLVTDPPLLSC